MKKVLLTLAIVLFVIALFAAWLWKLGAPPTLAASTARLQNVEGQVETRPGANGTWTAASEGQSLASGMQVRTGDTGSVTLTVSGVSQTRLTSSTELSVDTLVLPQGDELQSQMGITLSTGRTWSRIVRLLELDSSYTIKTDDVVATVRGTAFETAHIPGKESWIAVYDGTVSAKDASITQALPKGTGMRAARRAMQFVSSTNALPRNTGWLKKNFDADNQFLKDTQTELQQELTKDTSGKMFKLLGQPAERLHLAMTAKKDKAELADKYMGRRMAWAKELGEQGKTEEAQSELLRVKQEMTAWQNQAAPEDKDKLFRRAMVQSSILFQDAPPDASAQFLKDRVEELKGEIKPESLIPNPPLDAKVDFKIDALAPGAFEKPILAPLLPTNTSLPTKELDPTTQPPIVEDKSVLDARPPAPTPTKLILSGPPEPLRMNARLPLFVVIVYSNGTRRDGTAEATFVSSDPGVATVIDSLLQAGSQPGSVQVTASYRENGVSVSDSKSFTVQP